MREILFRGKTFDNRWVEGLLVWIDHNDETALIREIGKTGVGYFDFLVEFETVGQFTGLTDKNGRKIFEGDIVDCLEFYGEVYYDPEGCFDLRDNTPEMCGGFIGDYNSLEVVGNIHDNPNLLGGDDN